MKNNESKVDRIIRILLGVVLLVLGWGGFITGTLGLVFKILGFVPLITGVIGYCPIYGLFKLSTNKS